MHCFAPPISPLFVGKCANTPSVLPLRVKPPSPRGRLNSLSQSLTALTAPSEREPLAYPQTLCPNRKLYRHAKGPILEGAGCDQREQTGGVFLHDPSRENEIAERPQTLRYLEIKNIFPLIMPKAHAAGIPNRPYCSAMAFSTAFCRSVTEMVHSAFRSASVPSAESLPISTAFLPFR